MMGFLVSFFGWFGTAFTWLLKDFVPRIAKRLGIGLVLGAVQKAISLIVVAFVIAFFAIVINFAVSMFNQLSNFINYLSSVGGQGTWASCAVYMINVSGIASGIQMAAPFYLGVLVFFFIYAAYKIMHIVLKTISDETWNDPQTVDTFLFVNFVDNNRHGIRAGESNATEIYR